MANDVYLKLAKHLDDLPGGFPRSETGVELRILKRLFTPEQARLALTLTLIPEEPRVIARRAKIDVQDASRRLEDMARKGLIYRIPPKNGVSKYMATQFVIGIWEYHVNDLTPGLVRDMEEYIPTLFNKDLWKKAPQLRTVPVGRSIDAKLEIMSYENAEELVSNKHKAVVAPCICRRERKIAGEGCEKAEETCLVFGMGADYYERNGLGRVIDRQEVLDILKRADEEALVLQPTNTKKILNICCCCGCCCGILRNLRQYPKPAELVATAFVAVADPSTCVGCGVCEKRCQMDAITMNDKRVAIDSDRCIGCGLCISKCPTDSISLRRKPVELQPRVPENVFEGMKKLANERGKLNTLSMIRMQVQSKIDRILAPR